MSKYRIKEKKYTDSHSKFFPQKKFIFWRTMKEMFYDYEGGFRYKVSYATKKEAVAFIEEGLDFSKKYKLENTLTETKYHKVGTNE